MITEMTVDAPDRLAEMEREEKDARAFGITITQLRAQRRSLGQLLTGRYAGCQPGFARVMESVHEVSRLFSS